MLIISKIQGVPNCCGLRFKLLLPWQCILARHSYGWFLFGCLSNKRQSGRAIKIRFGSNFDLEPEMRGDLQNFKGIPRIDLRNRNQQSLAKRWVGRGQLIWSSWLNKRRVFWRLLFICFQFMSSHRKRSLTSPKVMIFWKISERPLSRGGN